VDLPLFQASTNSSSNNKPGVQRVRSGTDVRRPFAVEFGNIPCTGEPGVLIKPVFGQNCQEKYPNIAQNAMYTTPINVVKLKFGGMIQEAKNGLLCPSHEKVHKVETVSEKKILIPSEKIFLTHLKSPCKLLV
jgi:hypothetical protein